NKGNPAPIKVSFDSTNWSTPKTFYVQAFNTSAAEGSRDAAIGLSVSVSSPEDAFHKAKSNDGDTFTFGASAYDAASDVLTAKDIVMGGDPGSSPVAGGGLLGAIVTIANGPGRGQYRFVASNTATTITTDTPWATAPDDTSEFVIQRYEGIALPD